jgi:hypothetical protein
VVPDLFEIDPGILSNRPGQVILADKGYASAEFEGFLSAHGARCRRSLKLAIGDRKPAVD